MNSLSVTQRFRELNWGILLQMGFLLSVFSLLLEARVLHTGSHEASPLDGLYVPMLAVIATFVFLYLSRVSLARFVANSVLFTTTLSILMAVKYEYFKGADVNYMYRLITAATAASTFNAVSDLPSRIVGIYLNFPGFIFLNAAFIEVTGIQPIEAYKFLYPLIYGILYPTAFFLLSGLITNSDIAKRGIIMAASIPYALLPGVPWNYYMMPNYLALLFFLLALYLVLFRPPALSSSRPYLLKLLLLFVTIVITHPLASLFTAIVFTCILFAKKIMIRLSQSESYSLVSTSLVIFIWTTTLGWSVYWNRNEPFFQENVSIAILSLLEGFRIPSVTQRLGVGGPTVYLITHISKLLLGGLAAIGFVGLLRHKIPGTKIGYWMTSASIVLLLIGGTFFVAGYTLYDIYVGFRSLFLGMIVLTVGAGLGLATVTGFRKYVRLVPRGNFLRKSLLAILLIVVLTASLFELYPTEYVNPTLQNSVHTDYQKNVIAFLNHYWTYTSQIRPNLATYQVAESFAAANIIEDIVREDEIPFVSSSDPITTIMDGRNTPSARSNVIYNSGFTVVNSTLR